MSYLNFVRGLLCILLISSATHAITIDTVPVGNPGNAADNTGFGSVGYNYRIGKTEVTNAQYVEFLNGVDATGANALSLYSSSMSSDARGGINFNGGAANGSKYEIKPGRANNPVVLVSWYDSIRFANWLHNGQGSGDTENGAYTLLGGTPAPSNGNSITRNAGAQWWLPSENEWYKAAYHKNDGVTGNYWDYPTSTDAVPFSDQPPGSDAPTQSNTANFRKNDGIANGYDDGHAVTGSTLEISSQNYLTDVGAYTLSASPYGTFDQGGNVLEWNEALHSPSDRRHRGGSWGGVSNDLRTSSFTLNNPAFERVDLGFRVASIAIPEPSALLLLCFGSLAVLWRRRRLVCTSILAAVVGFSCADPAHADTFGSGVNTFDIEFVTIGNPGNAADDASANPDFAGSVSYIYRMGKFEISEQMIDKANAEGGLGLTKDTRGPDKPATTVHWNGAARFVNWLNTSSGSAPAYKFALQPGDGGYVANTNIQLWTPSDAGFNPNNLYRNSMARYFLPSDDEWYKAAYYDPTGGVYYDYPTGSETGPTWVASGTAAGTAVFNQPFDPGPADITLAGGLSPYGTMGQGGNVWEWEETDYDLVNGPTLTSSARGVRGGGWDGGGTDLCALQRIFASPGVGNLVGFRVASIPVPEPSTLLLLGFGSLAVLWRRRTLVCASILATVVGAMYADSAVADTFGSGANAFDIEFVTIGNPGNVADTTGNPNPAGLVPYTYRMGMFEISEQMIEKANAEGGLGITKDPRGPDKPATSVSWNEAARFINWLNTSTGSSAAYKFDASGNFQLWTPSDAGYNANNLYRNSLANFVLPSFDEWYKAAYYDPTANGGLGGYWNFPTGSDTEPTPVSSGTAAGTAVYSGQAGPADITAAGGLSPFGTMGQGGNVFEWEETANDLTNNVTTEARGVRGGLWSSSSFSLSSSARLSSSPLQGSIGFRVASIAVPEPSTLLLVCFGSLAVLWRRRRLVCTSILAAVAGFSCADPAHADTFGSGANTFDIEFVTIGNPGNVADTTGNPNPAGSVPYAYRLGKFEISESMIDKANIVGGLGITKDTRGPDKPATSTSWNEAARFVNWLNISSGSTPAYKFALQPGEVGYNANANIELWTISDAGYDPNNLYRNSLARYFLPSVDEWYKAAYYDPTSGVYYDYPTGSNSIPDGIDFAGDPDFDAVFFQGGNNAQPNDITNVGLLSPYGTAGQGGNVREWEETDRFNLVNGPSSSARGVRGGRWNNTIVPDLASSIRENLSPSVESPSTGFRVASNIPEPSTLLLLCFGSLAALWRRRRLVCASILAAVVCAATSAHAADIRTVALSGQQAPGLPEGVIYNGYSSFVLNDAGHSAFSALLAGSGVDLNNDQSMWSEGSGSLALVAREGGGAPGTPSGVNYSGFAFRHALVLNDAGQIAFTASVTGSGVDATNINGYWSKGSGSLALVARLGDHAPGAPSGVNYSHFFGASDVPPPVLNNVGQTAFRATLSDGSSGIWSDRSGSVAPVVRTGDQAPGLPSGVNFGGLTVATVLNDAGRTAFWASLTGSGVDSTNNESIWSEGSGSLALVAREGNQAPGTPTGVNYSRLLQPAFAPPPVLNSAGQTAFKANLTGSGVDFSNDSGIWSEGSGTLALVARTGDQAPGMPEGVKFRSMNNEVALNDAGQVAFKVFLTSSGPSVDSIWSEGSGSLALVARVGDHAPGTPDGVSFNFNSFYTRVMFNNAGQTAFLARLNATGDGIWATSRNGDLKLIARQGDLLEVAPGDMRTIVSLDPGDYVNTGNSDGRPSQFNNLGQLIFRASFTDGSSGIFVSNRVAVPEPNTLLLLCIGSLAMLGTRKGR